MRYPGVNIAAAAAPQQPRRKKLDPPKLISGKRPQQWTEQERRDAWMWNLGPRFRVGLKPPPEPHYYIPPIPGSACDVENSHSGSMAGLEF